MGAFLLDVVRSAVGLACHGGESYIRIDPLFSYFHGAMMGGGRARNAQVNMNDAFFCILPHRSTGIVHAHVEDALRRNGYFCTRAEDMEIGSETGMVGICAGRCFLASSRDVCGHKKPHFYKADAGRRRFVCNQRSVIRVVSND